MKPRFMLDTNICIYLMKHQPPEVAERFAMCYAGEVVISVISLAELEYGIACSGDRKDSNRAALSDLLQDVFVANFDPPAAAAYGEVRMASRGRKRDALDKMIAAHAIVLGVVLVTNNEADFVAYPGLTIENWVRQH